MKHFLLFASFLAAALGDIGIGRSTGGGYSISAPAGSYLPPSQNVKEMVADNYVPQVFKHVYIHTAPDEAAQQEKRVIRVPGGDKHVNIIFVKTPSQSSSAQTEVVLPEQDQQKNIVYVLVKKPTTEDNIKITRPEPSAPVKPEVHFIRYEDSAATQPQTPAGLYGTPAVDSAPAPPPPAKPSNLYGTPSSEALSPPRRDPPGRLYGTPEDVPPLAPSQPSGLYETPSQ